MGACAHELAKATFPGCATSPLASHVAPAQLSLTALVWGQASSVDKAGDPFLLSPAASCVPREVSANVPASAFLCCLSPWLLSRPSVQANLQVLPRT